MEYVIATGAALLLILLHSTISAWIDATLWKARHALAVADRQRDSQNYVKCLQDIVNRMHERNVSVQVKDNISGQMISYRESQENEDWPDFVG